MKYRWFKIDWTNFGRTDLDRIRAFVYNYERIRGEKLPAIEYALRYTANDPRV